MVTVTVTVTETICNSNINGCSSSYSYGYSYSYRNSNGNSNRNSNSKTVSGNSQNSVQFFSPAPLLMPIPSSWCRPLTKIIDFAGFSLPDWDRRQIGFRRGIFPTGPQILDPRFPTIVRAFFSSSRTVSRRDSPNILGAREMACRIASISFTLERPSKPILASSYVSSSSLPVSSRSSFARSSIVAHVAHRFL